MEKIANKNGLLIFSDDSKIFNKGSKKMDNVIMKKAEESALQYAIDDIVRQLQDMNVNEEQINELINDAKKVKDFPDDGEFVLESSGHTGLNGEGMVYHVYVGFNGQPGPIYVGSVTTPELSDEGMYASNKNSHKKAEDKYYALMDDNHIIYATGKTKDDVINEYNEISEYRISEDDLNDFKIVEITPRLLQYVNDSGGEGSFVNIGTDIYPVYDLNLDNNKLAEKSANYEGWSNYPSWAVALWLGNDEGLYNMVQEWKEELSGQEDAKYRLAEMVKDLVEENNPISDATMFADLMQFAIDEVDYNEVAEHLMAE